MVLSLIHIYWITLFEAYRYTTVATATLCYYMAPVFVTLALSLIHIVFFLIIPPRLGHPCRGVFPYSILEVPLC